MKYKLTALCTLLLALPLLAEKFHLNPSTTVPAATGMVDIGHDGNGNTTINVHVDHLAKPVELSPSRETYVVWAEGPNRPADNLGELKVNGDLKGDFKSVTTLRDFQLVITAENDPRAQAPMGPVVLSANIHQH